MLLYRSELTTIFYRHIDWPVISAGKQYLMKQDTHTQIMKVYNNNYMN